MELCVRLNVQRLFHVGHVVQNRWSVLSLAWHEWFSWKGREWKIYCSHRRQSLKSMNISRRLLADYVNKLHQKACRTCSTIIFPHLTNQVIDLLRCRFNSRRRLFQPLRADLHCTIFVACGKRATGLPHDLRLSQRFKTWNFGINVGNCNDNVAGFDVVDAKAPYRVGSQRSWGNQIRSFIWRATCRSGDM